MDMDQIIPLGVGLGLGWILGFIVVTVIQSPNSLLHLKYERLKQKTAAKLEMLYRNCDNNVRLPDEIRFKDLIDHLVCVDQTLDEKILGLNQIYLDLITNGTGSTYFVHILDVYGQIGAF